MNEIGDVEMKEDKYCDYELNKPCIPSQKQKKLKRC